MSERKLTIEKSVAGRRGITFNKPAKNAQAYLGGEYLRKKAPKLPELSEFDVVRHYTNLSRLNYSLDTHFYPLGSCTMKYNPRAYETVSSLDGFAGVHPKAPDAAVQGTLEFLYNTEKMLCKITGLDAFTLAPAAGAHGEWTAVLIAKAYHMENNGAQRNEIIVADSSHGTNPASANMGGFKVITVKSKPNGRMDVAEFKKALGPKTALVMLTLPNTLGLFEDEILEITKLTHETGALFYMDGANFNALIGMVKPAQMGVDMLHFNLHKTFSTPHGGGGPGSGPVGVVKRLEKYLPQTRINFDGKNYGIVKEENHSSIGRVRSFFGNVGVILRAYCYLRQHDDKTLGEISENAIINANYLRVMLKHEYPCMYDEICMHECVLQTDVKKFNGIKTSDVAKRILDYGFYAPTIYFPLIVPEALMIEPTETESKETLDLYIDAMLKIAQEAKELPQIVTAAPSTLPITRVDEVLAARQPDIAWKRD